MRCVSYGVLAALLLACVAPRSSALRLEPTGVSSVASPRNSHEKLEQLFVVTASEFPGEAVTSISTSAAHQVYVSYSEAQSPGRLATVRVIGDRAQSIQSATVSATDGKPGHLRISNNVDSSSVSYLRMEIQLHSVQQLQHIEILSSGDIAVEAPELFVSSPQAKLVVVVSGSGDVYLPPELRLLVQSLEIESASSGSIYVPASDITATNVQVTTTGSGDVKFGVSRQFNVASHVSIDSKSSGSCRVVVADFNTPQLEISTTGSGDVTVERVDGLNASSTTSLVGQCEYSVTGHGELNAGGVLCSSAVATVVGSGDIILQAKDSLTYQITGYADIRYVGSAPQSIVSSTGKLKSGAVKAVKDTPGSKPAWMDSYSLPPRRCSFVIGGDGYENIIESGEDGEDDDDKDDDETSPPSPVRGPTSVPDSTKAASSPSIHTRSWMPVLVIVLVVFIVWDRVKAWKRKSKRSGEKAPLLGSEAPVYI